MTIAAVIVLAAGEGTRMKSSTPKVLHRICGRSLVGHAVAAARAVGPQHLVVVVRHQRDRVCEHLRQEDPQALIADQDEIPGTGRAVECGLQVLPAGLTGTVLVTYADVPLLTGQTLQDLARTHEEQGNAVTVITAEVDDPTGYGRIVRSGDGQVAAIVEHKDAGDAQREIREINSGIYAFDAQVLAAALGRVGRDNAQGEKYLTDVLALARAGGGRVAAFAVDDVLQTEGVNDRVQLARLGGELNRRLLEAHMRAGVTVVDPGSTWVDVGVQLGRDVVLLPFTGLHGASEAGEAAVIGPNTTLTDVQVGPGAQVTHSHGGPGQVPSNQIVGPFAWIGSSPSQPEGTPE